MRPPPFLFALVLAGCSDWNLQSTDDDKTPPDTGPEDTFHPDTEDDSSCPTTSWEPEAVAASDTCHYDIGGFTPIVEWEDSGTWVCSLPVVADLDGLSPPEIIVNAAGLLTTGELIAYHGDGSGKLWQTSGLETGFGASPAVADLDDDGLPEILIVRQYKSSLFGYGEYSVVALSWDGKEIAESEHFVEAEFDYATAIAVSDMDHDGSPEVVAGRAILNADLTTRGVGQEGRGCPAYVGIGLYGEGAAPAIADMDLDGVEEVVVGNAMYDADGNTVTRVVGGTDGAVAIGNFDGDPEAEFVASDYQTLVAYDTNGHELWGPINNKSANILAIPSVADVDNDGKAEIITAGGNELWVLNAEDGSELWTAVVHDESGATGASLFDFDGDGVLEIVYIDEIEIIAFNGADGKIKFKSTDHASDTMYDYPVVADVDADGHAEVVVAHDGFYPAGVSVYGDETNSWAPARDLWNQHAYTITNVNDDLSVPTTATQNFTVYNSFHSALPLAAGDALADELQGEILDVCLDDCDQGTLWVTARARNSGSSDLPAGLHLALYAREDSLDVLVATAMTTTTTPSLMTSEAVTFEVAAADVADADALWLVVDDDGTGTSFVAECTETDNGALLDGPFCP